MSVLDSFKLDGKSAIVTGVSSGLGVAFTEALAEAGADVVVCARREDKLKENAYNIASRTKRKIIPVIADISKEEDIIKVVKMCEDSFGKIDILVNNAGIVKAKSSLDLTKEDWDAVVAVDLTGAFLLSKYAIKSMLSKNIKGSIINIASIYGLFGDVMPVPSYYASKGALVNLTRAMAVEFAQSGIRINAIAPGVFPSEMTTDILEDKSLADHFKGRTPMGRFGKPDELKGAAVFLASDSSSYITGHTLTVDGGWSAA
ncbi:MAG: glucose 1-dehydrogenase [Candidatus Parvarchaeota archaeon]|nr:glucose 1-dehydrogenase [Candidatus Parvarchaeota archaeon]